MIAFPEAFSLRFGLQNGHGRCGINFRIRATKSCNRPFGKLMRIIPAVVEVHGELGRKTLTEDFNGSRHLLLADLLILLLLGGSL